MARVTGSHDGASFQGAHLHWDQQWRLAEGRAPWSVAEPEVLRALELLRARGAQRALDLGCGIGRHALLLAAVGLQCHAADRSRAGLEALRATARRQSLAVEPVFADFAALPYRSGSFDYVLAWNVVYHGDRDRVRRAVGEVARVLRPGGLYQSTMLSNRNIHYGAGVEISAGTFVQPGGPGDKGYPHFYCDLDDVLRLHPQFRLLTVRHEEDDQPGSHHWRLLFEADGDRE